MTKKSARLGARAIAFGETVAFLSSVIPAEAGIQGRVTGFGALDSRLRGNDDRVASLRASVTSEVQAVELRKKLRTRHLLRSHMFLCFS